MRIGGSGAFVWSRLGSRQRLSAAPIIPPENRLDRPDGAQPEAWRPRLVNSHPLITRVPLEVFRLSGARWRKQNSE
jgi:hypothetical protein